MSEVTVAITEPKPSAHIDLCDQMKTVLFQVAECVAPHLAEHSVGIERNEAEITATRKALQEQIDGSYREIVLIAERADTTEKTLREFFSKEVDRLTTVISDRFGALDQRTLDLLTKINNEIEGDAGIVEMLKGIEVVVFERVSEFVRTTIVQTVKDHVASAVPTITMACEDVGTAFCDKLNGLVRSHENRIRHVKAA